MDQPSFVKAYGLVNYPPPVLAMSPEEQLFLALSDGMFVRSLVSFVAARTEATFGDALKAIRALYPEPHIAATDPDAWCRAAIEMGVSIDRSGATIH